MEEERLLARSLLHDPLVLYGSRCLNKEDVQQISHMILDQLNKRERYALRKLTETFDYHYVPITGESVLGTIELLYTCIAERKVVELQYVNARKESKTHHLRPLSIAFDQGYLYLIARPDEGTASPAVKHFRMDRVRSARITRHSFKEHQHGADYFKPGEHVNHAYLMHTSDNESIRAVLKVEPWLVSYLKPTFPVHSFVRLEEGREVYQVMVAQEDSLLFWLLQQRTWVEVLQPDSLREKLKQTIGDMARMYKLM